MLVTPGGAVDHLEKLECVYNNAVRVGGTLGAGGLGSVIWYLDAPFRPRGCCYPIGLNARLINHVCAGGTREVDRQFESLRAEAFGTSDFDLDGYETLFLQILRAIIPATSVLDMSRIGEGLTRSPCARVFLSV